MDSAFDVVIVGARAAGAATAMLLARHGVRVLAVDKAAYGSDTLSTHALMRGGVDSLRRWGLLDRVFAADTPVITNTTFRYGNDLVEVPIKPRPGMPGLAAPRRTVLDPIVVDAARAAGAEIHHETALVDVVRTSTGQVCGVILERADGTTTTVHTPLVVGADGLRSKLARLVDAPITRQGVHSSAYIVKYFEDLDVPRDSFRWAYGPGIGSGLIPTNGGATCVFAALERDRFAHEGRTTIDATFRAILDELNPEIADQLDHVTQQGRTRTWPGIVGQFRQASGPGWALVGDAGYFKDPFAAQGISDAFRDAELLADAVMTGDFETYEWLRDTHSAATFDALEKITSYAWDETTLPGIHFELNVALKAEAAALADHRAAHAQLAA